MSFADHNRPDHVRDIPPPYDNTPRYKHKELTRIKLMTEAVKKFYGMPPFEDSPVKDDKIYAEAFKLQYGRSIESTKLALNL